MPELPEVETIKRELSRKVVGKTIQNVEVRLPRMVAIGPETLSQYRRGSRQVSERFESLLRGKRAVRIRRRAKLLIFKFSGNLNLLVHLKLTGQLIFEKRPGARYKLSNHKAVFLSELPSPNTHVIFTFRDGSRLFYNDLRQFGYLRLINESDMARVKELQEFGPEPLVKSFVPEVLVKIINSRPTRKIKDLLMDQNLIAGIGNIYADEILFDSRISPTRLVGTLKREEIKRLYKSIQKILSFAISKKGSSSEHYIRSDGSRGDFVRFHRVYQRDGEPCSRCASPIKRIVLAGRGSHFCPTCQK